VASEDERRSAVMRSVKSVDTAPERVVRSLIFRRGFRFRLHRRDLPGCPDLVFSSRRKVVFVHGCFWHGHDCRRGARVPLTNRAYWIQKIAANVKRHERHDRELRELGWQSMVVWECELRDVTTLETRLVQFLAGSGE